MPTILLVDDDDMFAEPLQRTLARSGYNVIRARDGKEAIKLYEANPIDLVLTDLVIPEKEGVELIGELRNLQPMVKIVAMSGGGRNRPESYLAIAERLGVVNTLAKPFSNEKLFDTLRNAFSKPDA